MKALRVFVAILGMCAVGSVAMVPSTAHACIRPNAVAAIITYYSDATLTTVVGTTTIFCSGRQSTRGQVTNFYVEDDTNDCAC